MQVAAAALETIATRKMMGTNFIVVKSRIVEVESRRVVSRFFFAYIGVLVFGGSCGE